MKTKIYITLLTILFAANTFAQSKVEEIELASKELNQTREIMVYTPNAYEHNPYTLFNVIYVFDAQNREFFDYTSSIANISKNAGQGTIVVGIKATLIMGEFEGRNTWVYARNNDFLPSTTQRLAGRKGNMENFYKYVKNEVIPYVESNYRVLPQRMAVGHSLGASFLLYAMTESPDIFDNYVAISPNMEYDNNFILNRLKSLDINTLNSKKYFYMSHADEGAWGWGASNKEAYTHLRNKLDSEKFEVTIEQHTEENHMSSFIPALRTAMNNFLDTIKPEWSKELSKETYEVTFRVKVFNEEDDVFIFGNQESLANWQKDKIKMKRMSPFVREYTTKVQNHVEVQFSTDGKELSWVSLGGEGNRSNHPMMVSPKKGGTYTFEIVENKPF